MLIGAVLALGLVYASAKSRTRELSHGIEVEPYAFFLGKSVVLACAVLYFTYLIATSSWPAQRAGDHERLDRALRLRDAPTVIGRQIYAVGGNAKAAKLSGIKPSG